MFNSSNSRNITLMVALLLIATITLIYVWISWVFDSPIYADITHANE